MTKFLALYMGPADGTPPPQSSPETMAEGMAAWQDWMAQHSAAVIDTGGPLGKTKKASKAGFTDTRNNVAGYIIVEAPSHDAAVRMFEGHPHFNIFPGDSIEVMECLPIPGA